jgi:hypothetical protein
MSPSLAAQAYRGLTQRRSGRTPFLLLRPLIWINNLASGIEKHAIWPVLPLNEASPTIAVGMTWNDLRLILLILGVLVALYLVFLAFA